MNGRVAPVRPEASAQDAAVRARHASHPCSARCSCRERTGAARPSSAAPCLRPLTSWRRSSTSTPATPRRTSPPGPLRLLAGVGDRGGDPVLRPVACGLGAQAEPTAVATGSSCCDAARCEPGDRDQWPRERNPIFFMPLAIAGTVQTSGSDRPREPERAVRCEQWLRRLRLDSRRLEGPPRPNGSLISIRKVVETWP
jgi:hypothetical protein